MPPSRAESSRRRSASRESTGQEGAFRRLPGKFLEGLGQVVPIMKKEHPPRPLPQEKCQEGDISFGGVAGPAGEDQVVGSVIGRLALPWPYVVQGDLVRIGLGATVSADRTVPVDEPLPVGLIGSPPRTT